MLATRASRSAPGSDIHVLPLSGEQPARKDAWSGRSTALIGVVLGVGLATIVIEPIVGDSLLSRETALRAGSMIDSMALGIGILGFAALGAHNRAAPDRLNALTGAILGVLAVLVLPIDLVLAERTSISITALAIATQLSMVTLSFSAAIRPLEAGTEKLRQVVGVVLAMTVATAILLDLMIRGGGLDHEQVLRFALGSSAILLAGGAFRMGAIALRSNEPRGVVLALTLLAIGVANAHASRIESSPFSTTAGKAMRLFMIATILIYTVVKLRDLALREREIALLAQNESERAADRLVSQMTFQERFVHDTRNALLAIQGGLRSLGDGSNNSMVEALSSEVDRLRILVEGTDGDPLPVTFDLVRALEPMISCYTANGCSIRLVAHAPVLTRGRPSIAAEVGQNLIENAIAHGGGGEITVSVFSHDGFAEVQVADRGTGVDIDLRDSIFEHGTSGGASSGVGLHISRRLIERQGGSIEVTDREGGGAIFAFRLPLASPSHCGDQTKALAGR